MNDLGARKQLRHKGIRFARPAVACVLANALLLCRPALGQAPAPTPQSSSSSYSGGQSSNSQSSNPGAGLSQSPFSGSVPEGKPTAEVLPLSFKDAIDRGLRNNLGLLLQSDASLTAQGEKWKELSELLPHLNATVNESVEQIDFAALGFRFNIPGVPNVVGPIGVFQTGAYLTQSVFDYHAIQRKRGASYNEKAALNSLKNARELVVLAVGNSYLVTLSGAARVDTAQADVTTAQALYDKAADQQKAGVIPAIDALRAHVELQSRQQELIVARNDYAKQKLTLGRVIGLPPGQEFSLTTAAPYEPLATLPLEQDLQRAYASRPDYLAAAQQVRSAEEFRRAATSEYYPSLDIAGDYGAAGIRPGSSHGVFEVGATLNIPIFTGGRTHADVIEAEATLRQSRQQLENLRGQVDYEVRSARLDLNAAADQVEVARSTVDLATQTLAQAQDRFTAGVTDNLEVVQAQDALTSANQTYISALYSHNLAKIELAKAVGFAEEGVRQYLQNQSK
ncbi:MAG: TolC family protein [Terriglobales bacterium]|jgi:outer membrane protein TolC